ncbi:hypothetical protein BH23PAT2_BH23PAT2_03230 [soil metagenome]
MKPYDWSDFKNSKLKNERSVSFEDVLTAIDEGKLLDAIRHPNKLRYGNQQVLVVEIDDYAYLVPFVEDNDKIFLKTIIPSRRATKKYLRGEKS